MRSAKSKVPRAKSKVLQKPVAKFTAAKREVFSGLKPDGSLEDGYARRADGVVFFKGYSHEGPQEKFSRERSEGTYVKAPVGRPKPKEPKSPVPLMLPVSLVEWLESARGPFSRNAFITDLLQKTQASSEAAK